MHTDRDIVRVFRETLAQSSGISTNELARRVVGQHIDLGYAQRLAQKSLYSWRAAGHAIYFRKGRDTLWCLTATGREVLLAE